MGKREWQSIWPKLLLFCIDFHETNIKSVRLIIKCQLITLIRSHTQHPLKRFAFVLPILFANCVLLMHCCCCCYCFCSSGRIVSDYKQLFLSWFHRITHLFLFFLVARSLWWPNKRQKIVVDSEALSHFFGISWKFWRAYFNALSSLCVSINQWQWI